MRWFLLEHPSRILLTNCSCASNRNIQWETQIPAIWTQKIKIEWKNKAWCCSPGSFHCRKHSGVLIILNSLTLKTHNLQVSSVGFSWAQGNSRLAERQLLIPYQPFSLFSEENVLRESNITAEQRLLKCQSKAQEYSAVQPCNLSDPQGLQWETLVIELSSSNYCKLNFRLQELHPCFYLWKCNH